MGSSSGVYIQVIEDVINKVRDDFVNNAGPGDSVLLELQALWEAKMMQAGSILGPIERSAAPRPMPGGVVTPVHDLNVPYQGTEEYETPTTDLLFPPTPMQTPLPGSGQTPLPGTAQTPLPGTAELYNIPTAGTPFTPGEYPSENGGVSEMKPGRPSQLMQPPAPWLNQRPPLDVNVAYDEGREEVGRGASHEPTTQDFFTMSAGKRKRDASPSQHNNGYIPQQDGSGDAISDGPKEGQVTTAAKLEFERGIRLSSRIPQADGPTDPYDDALSTPNIYNYQGVVNEDYNIVSTPAPEVQAATTPAVTHNDVLDDDDDDDDEPLNENDDDDDLDDVNQGEDLNTQHLVLAQFDKVTRTKSRWKCTLKDGIMHINNKDILFNKANGEFDF